MNFSRQSTNAGVSRTNYRLLNRRTFGLKYIKLSQIFIELHKKMSVGQWQNRVDWLASKFHVLIITYSKKFIKQILFKLSELTQTECKRIATKTGIKWRHRYFKCLNDTSLPVALIPEIFDHLSMSAEPPELRIQRTTEMLQQEGMCELLQDSKNGIVFWRAVQLGKRATRSNTRPPCPAECRDVLNSNAFQYIFLEMCKATGRARRGPTTNAVPASAGINVPRPDSRTLRGERLPCVITSASLLCRVVYKITRQSKSLTTFCHK